MTSLTLPPVKGVVNPFEATKDRVLDAIGDHLDRCDLQAQERSAPVSEEMRRQGEQHWALVGALGQCKDPQFWVKAGRVPDPVTLLTHLPCARCTRHVGAPLAISTLRYRGTVLCLGCGTVEVEPQDSGEEGGAA